MGFTHWSHDAYSARADYRRRTGTDAFDYDRYVRSTGCFAVHDRMNPFGVRFRESRDSAAHPTSLALAVFFDVTGSMGDIPYVFQRKLGALMHTLIAKGYVEHPQLLFGALGDAYCDRVPLQVGQFESGLEMDDDLGRIVIERGGGGQITESYELALYFAARHTAIDCHEKRGKKGYLFTMGDEAPYPFVSRHHVANLIGDRLQHDVPTAAIVREVEERYHYYHLIVTRGSQGRNPAVHRAWRDLLGQQALFLDDPAAVCETIALQVGLSEGTVADLDAATDDLVRAGCDADAAAHARNAVVPYAPGSRWTAVASSIRRHLPALPPGPFRGDGGL